LSTSTLGVKLEPGTALLLPFHANPTQSGAVLLTSGCPAKAHRTWCSCGSTAANTRSTLNTMNLATVPAREWACECVTEVTPRHGVKPANVVLTVLTELFPNLPTARG
jgi:hypothetical protein